MRKELYCPDCHAVTVLGGDRGADAEGWPGVCEGCGGTVDLRPVYTFNLRDVVIALRYKVGLGDEGVAGLVEEYIAHIEEREGRTIVRDEISEDDYDLLVCTVSAAQRSGNLGARELEELSVTMRAIRAAELDRDPQIRAALKAGARVKDLVDLTGLSRARIYQIKDAG